MSILTDLKDFLMPRHCVCCGNRLSKGERAVCAACWLELPYTGMEDGSSVVLDQCFWGRFDVERTASMLYYRKGGKVAEWLYAMKYRGHREACIQAGRFMGKTMADSGKWNDIDFIIPVPLHRSRERLRGYNQSELMARGMSQVMGIPVCTSVLKRSHSGETQTHRSGYERWRNAEGAFSISGRTDQLAGKHVLVVDDVLTTGATLTACCDVLGDIPGIRISIATLAWAKGQI